MRDRDASAETKEIKVGERLLKLVMGALAILLGVVGGIALAALLDYLQGE